jgi:uncharacterized cupredoxin-like copper-binding protein
MNRSGETRPRRRVLKPAAALLLTASVLGGCNNNDAGSPGNDKITREVIMRDNTYQPAVLYVGKGEKVTLDFINKGLKKHEGYIGILAAQIAHDEEMASMAGMPGMDHGNGDNVVTVEPGRAGTLTYAFNESTLIVCHEPGHWNKDRGGMQMTVVVTP